MDRLKTRQRLSKLNTLGSPAPLLFNEVINQQPDDELGNAHLASRMRVASLINQSIPDISYAPKKKLSRITAQEIEEFQRKENTPIEIDGQLYRMHPASIPEPDFDEADLTDVIKESTQLNAEAIQDIRTNLDLISQAETRFFEVRDQAFQLDANYDRFVGLQATRPVSEAFRLAQEAGYLEEKRQLEEERDAIIAYIDAKEAENGALRINIDEFEAGLPEALAKNNAIKIRNKAKVKAYEDNLKVLNRTFNLVQEQGETNEAYIARLASQTQAIEDPNASIDRLNIYEARRFKDNLKDIIRDTSVIETAYNTLFKEDDSSIIEVNKLFALIKSRYEKMYGKFQLKEEELIRFLRQMIENPEETLRLAEEEEAQIASLASGGAGGRDFTDKYKALSKAKYTKPKLAKAIERIFDYFSPDDFETDVGGKPTVLSKGPKGGYNVNYNGSIKSLRLSEKPILLALYVGLLEKLKRDDPASYEEENARLNAETDGNYGEGLGVPHEELPKSCKLGKIDIDLNKLFYKNILSISHNGTKINGAKNTPVGDEFVKIILDLCKGKYPTTKDLNKLEMNETQTFDALLYLAGLHKRVEHTANKTVQTLKQRLALIEGQIGAGNTNRDLYAEIKDIVFKLHHLGEITQNSANDYLKQLK